MNLKALVLGLSISASVPAQTLQEFVRKEGLKERADPQAAIYRQTFWDDIAHPKISLIFNEGDKSSNMVTEIVIYRIGLRKEGLELKGGITVIDTNSDRKFGPGDFICYSTSQSSKTYDFSEATPQVIRDFYSVYELAEAQTGTSLK